MIISTKWMIMKYFTNYMDTAPAPAQVLENNLQELPSETDRQSGTWHSLRPESEEQGWIIVERKFERNTVK